MAEATGTGTGTLLRSTLSQLCSVQQRDTMTDPTLGPLSPLTLKLTQIQDCLPSSPNH